MNSLPEPPYVIGLHEVFWGGALVAITMAMHGFGMLPVLRVVGNLKHRFKSKPSFVKGMFTLIVASWMIIIVHLLEVFAWAIFFLQTHAVNSTNFNGSLCYYVALLDYTTLGCDYSLVSHWRLLEGMIAMCGLLTFAWSTGVLFTLAQDFQNQQLQLLKAWEERRHTRPKTG